MTGIMNYSLAGEKILQYNPFKLDEAIALEKKIYDVGEILEKEACVQAQENLMRAKTNEEKLLYEEYELGDVGNEVKITSTEQCGSIDSEDSADDALTKTIKTASFFFLDLT
uniref:Myosin motor domain-containing protein n=1 Tax=Angiostrongylus cantonensis TaxID=6313 RepID=A0A0K0D4P9_ANGCA